MSFKSACWSFDANAKLRGTSNLNPLGSRYARVKYRSGEFSWTVSNGGALWLNMISQAK